MEKIVPEVIRDPKELADRLAAIRRTGKRVGLVPTMGALHYGHLSLVLASKSACDVTVVSVFVNPTQFAPGEDYEKYPRTLDADLAMLDQIDGVDFVFAPAPDAVYPRGFDASVHIGGVTKRLEGEFRPTHFDGVALVVLKLFNITGADKAFFGQKDYQQAAVIKKMVRDLNLPIEIEVCPIVREKDGLAMSSRNQYLSEEERKNALVLYEALGQAEFRIHSGQRETAAIRDEIRRMIEKVPGTKIDYVSIAEPDSLEELARVAGNVVVLLAVRFGSTRLIDNMIIQPR